jgi:ribose 5-phosphate isomerase B
MVVNPLEDIERYATLAPTPRFISFHVESKSDPETVIKKIREYGIKPAIALNPATPLSDISGLLDKVDMVLLMSVVPGLPGQGYIESVTDKIAELRGMIFEQGLDTLIEVDGGIKLHNVKYPINAGADVIVSGTGVFSDAGRTPTNVIEEMKRMKRNEKLAVASDHGGCALKKQLLEYFDKKGIEYHDFGCPDEKSVDYPVYADYVAKAVQKHEYSRGILVCGTGIGISIRANRYPGIRATLCYNKFTAEMSRKHNNSNVLVMGGRTTSPAKAKTIFNTWYTTEYEGGRHQKRVAMLDAPLK